MKKPILVLILFVFAIIALSACKSAQKCPAYGDYSQYKTVKR